YAAYAPSVPGAVDRSPAFWSLHEHGGREDGAFLYGVRTGGELTGYVAYTQTLDAGRAGAPPDLRAPRALAVARRAGHGDRSRESLDAPHRRRARRDRGAR